MRSWERSGGGWGLGAGGWSLLGLLAAGSQSLLAACSRSPEITGDIAIVGVTVIDGTDRTAAPNQTVVISGDRIVAVRPAAAVRPKVTTALDGRGKYVIPGLWDMHVHLFGYEEHSFPLFLANGITTIRDMSGNLATSLWLRQETRFGRLLGPEMLISGPTLDSPYIVKAVQGTPYAAARESVPDSASAVAMVDSLSRVGVDHIKVHGMTPRTAYFAIMAEAKRRGIPVVGHVPDSLTAREAIAAGQRTIEHDSGLEEALSGRASEIIRWKLSAMQRVIRSAGPKPAIGPIFQLRIAAADSALLALDQPTARAFAEFAAKQDVWFDPTLVVLEALARVNEPAVRNPPETKYTPTAAREMTEGFEPKPNATEADIAAGRRQFKNGLLPLAPLLKAGVKFVAGSDIPTFPLVPGFSLQRELGLLVEAGFTPLQAIQAATRNAADAAGKLDQVGTVETGKRASLVLLDADPLVDIANTKRIRAVISRGRLLDRATLDRMLADALAYAKHR